MEWRIIFALVLASAYVASAQQCYSCSAVLRAAHERKKRGILDGIKDFFDDAVNKAKEILNNIKDGAENSDVMKQLSSSLDTLWSQVAQAPELIHNSETLGVMKQLVARAETELGTLSEDVKDKFSKLLNEVSTEATSAASLMQELSTAGVIPANLQLVVECGSVFREDSIATCTKQSGHKCAKIQIQVGSETTYARSCVSPLVCNTPNYYCCDGDRCNGSWVTMPSVLVMAAATITALVATSV